MDGAADFSLKQVKGENSKCFRYKSSAMKLWDQKVDYNYYPVCYEALCKQDATSPLGWTIDVTIGNTTVTC